MNIKENYYLEFHRGGILTCNEWEYNEELGEGKYVERILDDLDWLHKRDRPVYFHDDVTLYDAFLFVQRDPEICDIVFPNCFIKEYVGHFQNALDKFHSSRPVRKYDPDGIEYIELYWNTDLSEYEGVTTIDGMDRACCHGIGYELKEDKYEDYSSDPVWKSGQRINWGIDFCSLSDMLDLPIKLNTKFEVYDDWMKYKDDYKNVPILLSCERKFTLYQAIEAVFWELSFYGSEEEKTEKKNELDDIMTDIKENGYTVIDDKFSLRLKEELNDGYENDGMGWEHRE
jgi:hypothetical protein